MVRGPAQRQIRPSRVYQTVTTLMKHRIQPELAVQQPVWYKVVESIPPSEILTRPFPPQHKQPNPRARKASRLFQPQKLVYREDELRKKFYTDHPWELARPRMIIEMDGKDSLRCDWSKGLRQPGMPLSGECVVQRQMYLMDNVPGITEDVAYDQVRKEFYELRQEEDIERRIAQEEARMVGSYFGQTFLQVGMKLEDQQFERWKRWATREIGKIQGEHNAAYSPFEGGNDSETADMDVDSLREDLESTANIPPA
ncbi:mitochondrial 37S ribosomal protein mS23 [Apiospora kogelbergensis]|uniref:Small ribosomal subunit protein mS23 n=1 Tax=Apiospora kogelbergensis TaxID=1337665 RepID=A0AAW0R7X2_9PEZI